MVDKDPINQSFEALIQAHPDISVRRSRTGTINIAKKLSPTSHILMFVNMSRNIQDSESPKLAISAFRDEVGRIVPISQNWNSYIYITRPDGKDLQVEVIYPKKAEERIEYDEMLQMAAQGLEIFDAYQHNTTPHERMKFPGIVFDEMEGRELKQDIGEIDSSLVKFLENIGFDLQGVQGNAKMAHMVIQHAKTLHVTNIHENSV